MIHDNKMRTNHWVLTWVIFAGLTWLLACKEETKTLPGKENSVTENMNLKAGWDIVSSQCFTCHNPDATAITGIAPTMADVKIAYLHEEQTLESFARELEGFLQNPTADKSRMPEAVKKYGVMPKLSLTPEQVMAVAAYIYHTPLEEKSWFTTTFTREKEKYEKMVAKKSPLETGKDLAMKTKAVLGKNLLNAIKTRGTDGAVDFCSTRAIFLTDSMATELNARVKRVSDKNRNPKNAANPEETAYLDEVRKMMTAGQKVAGKITEKTTHYVGYYPIITDEMCLQCHGKKDTEILPGTQKILAQKYPADKAFGYALNDLRGLWVVEFDKK